MTAPHQDPQWLRMVAHRAEVARKLEIETARQAAEATRWRSDLELAAGEPGVEGDLLRAHLAQRARRLWFWRRLSIAVYTTAATMAFGIGWGLLVLVVLFLGATLELRDKGIDIFRDLPSRPFRPRRAARGAALFGAGAVAGFGAVMRKH